MVADITVGLALLLAPAIAEHAKLRNKAEKGFTWMAVAGALILFSAVSAGDLTALAGVDLALLSTVLGAVGWIVALVGTVFVGYEALMEK